MNFSRNAEGMYVSIANTNAKKILALLGEMPNDERRKLIQVLMQLQDSIDLASKPISGWRKRQLMEKQEREEYLND
jgi:hypothetical protein